MAIKTQQEPTIEHQSDSVPPISGHTPYSPSSPSLTDMELEIDIELTGPGDSPPMMPAPGEDPMLPKPPIQPIPPKTNALGFHHPKTSIRGDVQSMEQLEHRSQGQEGLLRQRSRKRADAVSAPNGAAAAADLVSGRGTSGGMREEPPESLFLPPQHDAWSKKQIYEHSVNGYLEKERAKQSHVGQKQTKPLLYPFKQMSIPPSSSTTKGDPGIEASQSKSKTRETLGPLTRFLPPNKEEAFIGFMPNSAQGTIEMVKRECPSLTSVPSQQLSLALHFDGSPSWVKDVLFRVMPEAWPAAVTGTLPLIHVKHNHPPQHFLGFGSEAVTGASLLSEQIRAGRAGETRRVKDGDLLGAFEDEGCNTAWKGKKGMTDKSTQVEVIMQGQAKGREEKTWDQLVKEGVLLGIH